MLIKLKSLPSVDYHPRFIFNAQTMIVSDDIEISSKDLAKISTKEISRLRSEYNEWCQHHNMVPDQDIIKDLATPEEKKANKLSELKASYQTFTHNLSVESSLGFAVNCNVDTLVMLDMLINTYVEPVMFRDFNNDMHTLNKDELSSLKQEVFTRLQKVLQQKWDNEALIEANKEPQDFV